MPDHAQPTTPSPTPSLANRFFQGAMSPAFRDDPYPFYERFRGPNPLLQVADTIWFAMGHADVTALLRNPKLSTDESKSSAEKAKAAPQSRSRSLLFMAVLLNVHLLKQPHELMTPRVILGFLRYLVRRISLIPLAPMRRFPALPSETSGT